jgi:hypothetical protein
MLRASLGKVVHTVKRAGTHAAKVPSQELHKIAVRVRAVVEINKYLPLPHPLFFQINNKNCLPRPPRAVLLPTEIDT